MLLKNTISSFDFKGVAIKKGLFAKQQQDTLEYYLSVPDDDYLWGFRTRKGIPAPGRQLDGWYGRGVYHVFGQLLGGLAKLWCATGDIRAKEKAFNLFYGWAECMEEDGYAFNNPRGEVFDPYYEYEKLAGGLVDCIHYLGLGEAEAYLEKLTIWAEKNLDRRPAQQIDGNTSHCEWHTLSETLFRAYLDTGNERYLNFARVWEYPFFWNKYLNTQTFNSSPVHAYSHVNTLCGAAMAYRVTGESRYLEIIKNAYAILTEKHIYATGGYGPSEKLFNGPGYLGQAVIQRLSDGWGNVEVSCCSYAVFKLCRYLLEFTGDALYADWIEKILYNCMGPEPVLKKGGKILYYADYYIGGAAKLSLDGRTNGDGLSYEWPCCSGTFPQAVAEYANLCYYKGNNAVYISQYLPAEINTEINGVNVRLCMDTDYPEGNSIKIHINSTVPDGFRLLLRKPEWLKQYNVSINGMGFTPSVEKGWMRLEHAFSDGDTVTLLLDQPFYFVKLDEEHPQVAALCRGAVVFAGDSTAYLDGDIYNTGEWIRPSGNPSEYESAPGHVRLYPFKQVKFRPFYAIPEGEPYFIYYKVNAYKEEPK